MSTIGFSVTYAQMTGGFQYGNDGRLYLVLENHTGYALSFTGSVYSPLRNAGNSEPITVLPQNCIYLGPSTKWHWQWCFCDSYTITYPNGYTQTWTCTDHDYYAYPKGLIFGGSNPEKTYIKETQNKCDKCSCDGYKGIYHYLNGSYEGNCINTDKGGHRCGHSPEHHKLKKW